MTLVIRSLSFIFSLIITILIIVFSYRAGKKRGIKKALYRITYRCICVILSFFIAPYLTDYILNFDLYPHGLAIHYNGLNFYRIIDFIEEVIVHNNVLNDIYFLFPNLKSLLTDFPHVIFIPFAYLISFIIFSILLLPLYLYMSYRRKKRNLYDVTYKNSGKVWAGILTSVQMIFLISIILTPINGLVRIYTSAKKGQIGYDDNICAQSVYLEKYEAACLVIEGYDSTVFSLIGYNPANRYIYDSLTRVEYSGNQTTFSNEIVSIAKAGIILNKTGLLDAINTSDMNGVTDLTKLNFHGLTLDDINTIIEAFENSLYTREVLNDVYEWARAYLNYLLKDNLAIDVDLEFTYEELVHELRVILSTINLILNNDSYMKNIDLIYSIIDEFARLPLHIQQNGDAGLMMFLDVVYNLDMDALRHIYSYVRESQIYRLVVPKLFDSLFSQINVYVNMSARPDEMDMVIRLCFDLFDVIRNHMYNYNMLSMLAELSDSDLLVLARLATYVSETETMNTMFYDLATFGIGTLNLKFDIPTELLLEVEDWYTEFALARLVIQVINKHLVYEELDFDLIWYGLRHYTNTVLFDYAWKWAVSLLPDAARAFIAGKGFEYLVGEYVQA